MKRQLRGGIETIVGVVILVGLVIVGIVTAVIPIIDNGEDLSTTATGAMGKLQGLIQSDEE